MLQPDGLPSFPVAPVFPGTYWPVLQMIAFASVALTTRGDLVIGRENGTPSRHRNDTAFPVWNSHVIGRSNRPVFVSDPNLDGNARTYLRFRAKLEDYSKYGGKVIREGTWKEKDREKSEVDRTAPSGEEWSRDREEMESGGLQARLPQAIIIGVKKGGTRALLEFLKVHPDIKAPGPEIHFFDRHYDKGLDWYRSLMPKTSEGEVTVEKTPSYFVTSSVPSRVFNMSRTVKLILVVRDPVTRAISDYTQASTKRRELRSFEQMAFLDNTTGPVATSWGAIRIGLYAKHLERWLQYFPISQFHFVKGERLIDDPAAEMALIEDFLGVRRVVTGKYFYFNTTKGFPCLRKLEGTGSPHCLGKTKGRVHPVVDEKVLQRLRLFYQPFNEKFSRLAGINFGWP